MTTRRRRDDPEVLLEAATTAVRERDASGRIQPSPAWADLTPEQCDELFERQLEARSLERGLDREGLSSTGRSVAERAWRLPQLFGDG
jgi:hypothetical protein